MVLTICVIPADHLFNDHDYIHSLFRWNLQLYANKIFLFSVTAATSNVQLEHTL
jgi:hypothetical protein